MVSEAEQILDDVLKSTSELKELLAFSAELQQAVCLLDLVSSCACMDYGTYLDILLMQQPIGIFFLFSGIEKESYFCTSHVKDINWFL